MMPESKYRVVRSPSPKASPSVLPPLSKFYYGPAQGWASADSSPSHNASAWSLNHNPEIPPTLPPRLSPGIPAYTSPQWSNNFPQTEESAQGWQSPSPLPSTPFPSEITNMAFNNSYAFMPGARDSAVNTTWESGPPDTSTCGVNYKHIYTQPRAPYPISKPTLPPRPSHPLEQHTSYTSKTSSSRLSATTIDVPLFLQPVAYDPESAPPLPSRPHSPQEDVRSPTSPPQPQRLPPPPPQKIPLDYDDESEALKGVPWRPQHDKEHSYDDAPAQSPPKLRRPQFDPQNSHDFCTGPPQREVQGQRHRISTPHFTSFDVDSTLPPVQPVHVPSMPSQRSQPQLTSMNHTTESDRCQPGQNLRQSSISPVGPNDTDRWMPGIKPWESHTAHVPSPEQQHTIISQDGHSICTSDLSSNTAGKSTPESQQTSNTSHRESEHQVDQSNNAQQTDDSFYWHSGQSSSEAEGDHSQIASPAATPGDSNIDRRSSATTSTVVPHEYQSLPPRSTSLSPAPVAPYGASALGFGGPSDWEYFGDYEAEEIDDEELYSRPRARVSASTKVMTAELPGDSLPSDTLELENESKLRGSGPAPSATPPSAGKPSSKQLKISPSLDNVKENAGDLRDDTNSTAARPPSGQMSSEPHIIPTGAGVPSTTSSEARPDLDDVIRAWSEAPYVPGKFENSKHSQDIVDVDEEPPDVAEASLASTPQERFLSVDVILRDPPSLPTLPASLEHMNNPEERHRPDSNSLMTNADIQLIPEKNKEIAPDPKQPQGHRDLLENREAILTKDASSVQVVTDEIQDSPTPSPDRKVLSRRTRHNVHTRPDLDSTSTSDVSIEKGPESETKLQVKVAPRASQIIVTETSKDLITQDASQNVIKEHMEGHPQGNSKATSRMSQMAMPPIVQENRPESRRESSGEGSKIGASAEVSPRASQEIPPIAQTDIAQEMPQETLGETWKAMPHQTSHEDLRDGKYIIPSQRRSSEHLETLHAVENVSAPHSKPDATNKLSQQENMTEQPTMPTTSIQGSLSKAGKAEDPYGDLDPWAKASLNRFAAMLREEARAESNKDKLNIFNVFTSRESRLRVVLYGTDDELIIPQNPAEPKMEIRLTPEEVGFGKQAVQQANATNLQRSLKALPALPSDRDGVIGLPGNALAPLVMQDTFDSMLKVDTSQPSAEESSSDALQYTPGGRPIIARLSTKESATVLKQHTCTSSAQSSSVHSPYSDAPIAPGSQSLGESEKPAPVLIRRNEGGAEVKNYLANRKSVCRPYATLTQGTLESGSNFGREPEVKLPSLVSGPMAAPTSQYNPSLRLKGDDALDTTIKPKAPGVEAQSDLRRFVKADFDPLCLVLPESEATLRESARLEDLKNVMEAIPDDFGFIHQSVVAWDAKAKKQREKNDRQRHARQIESEQRIDSLFDDHEIGYGDISELEAEFKQSEAARRAEEDRSEYQAFVADVFNTVWTRLHYELDQLIPHYEQYSKLMNDTVAGKDMFENLKEGLALAPTMSAFLGLHQKLEIRHQKAFEAVLERDRRLKKTEISPWYTLSNIAKVKQLEKQFEDAEKNAIIEYCQQRNTRANRLMDVLDQNTLRGVGANQDYMEAIMKAVRRIASGRAFASVPGWNEPTAGLEEVEKAKAITALLSTSSEQIVQMFHVADMLLNSADYELSLAKAKVARADPATLNKLKEERMKEDQKLMRDLEHRLALVREDSRRTNDEIVKLMLFLGIQNGRADTAPVQAGPADAGHEVRIPKPLEQAKRRNALKESGG